MILQLPDSSPIPWLRLALTRDIGPALAWRLIRRFGSPDAIFGAPAAELTSVESVGGRRLESLLSEEAARRAQAEWDQCAKLGVAILHPGHPGYPEPLMGLANPPLTLYVRGEIKPEDTLALAVVGPRVPSDYARVMTRRLIPPLCSAGLAIVSGLANGIDAEAHEAALECGGRTLAAVAQGLAVPLYPANNRKLAERIAGEGRGAIVSFFPLETRAEPRNFPMRNEIIAGLSAGTLVVEAGERSGALITAGIALDLGRQVMALPGDATRPNAMGSNRLIADGAALVQQPDDILRILAADLMRLKGELERSGAAATQGNAAASGAPAAGQGRAPLKESEEPLERLVGELLETGAVPADLLIEEARRAGFGLPATLARLLDLELDDKIQQMPGRVYILKG